MHIQIREERTEDYIAIDAVLERAFAGRVESDLVVALRAGGYAPLALVAIAGDTIVGHIMFCRLQVVCSEGTTDALGLAPLAVHPDIQRRGIGTALVQAGLERARAAGESLVFVLGDPAYYGRFGFSAVAAEHFECVYACQAFQVLSLAEASAESAFQMRGTVVYPPPFDASGHE
jgi:putative acetyltransferase